MAQSFVWHQKQSEKSQRSNSVNRHCRHCTKRQYSEKKHYYRIHLFLLFPVGKIDSCYVDGMSKAHGLNAWSTYLKMTEMGPECSAMKRESRIVFYSLLITGYGYRHHVLYYQQYSNC